MLAIGRAMVWSERTIAHSVGRDALIPPRPAAVGAPLHPHPNDTRKQAPAIRAIMVEMSGKIGIIGSVRK